jgi:putative ATP-dependent endonuclease of the OLD family
VYKGLKKGLKINTFISTPNFEVEFLESIKGASKPYEAWKYFSENNNEYTERFYNILRYIKGEVVSCDNKYESWEELLFKAQAYIRQNGLESDPAWQIESHEGSVEVTL